MFKNSTKQFLFFFWVISIIFTGSSISQTPQKQQKILPLLKGPYLGQNPPGNKPELFAPGIISSPQHEHSSAIFSPDMKEVYWCNRYRRDGIPLGEIFFMTCVNGIWSKPQVTPFTAMNMVDCNPALTYNGNRLYFVTCRPTNQIQNYDIWVVNRTEKGWSGAESLGAPVNTDYGDGGPSVAKNGTLYFFSNREGGKGGTDIYRSKLVNGRHTEPENLGDGINTECFEYNSFISPDESYILFARYNNDKGFGKGDLYISFRKEDGSWSRAKNLGNNINTAKEESSPWISPDGKYLFFTSDKNGNMDVYWSDAKIIEELKPKK